MASTCVAMLAAARFRYSSGAPRRSAAVRGPLWSAALSFMDLPFDSAHRIFAVTPRMVERLNLTSPVGKFAPLSTISVGLPFSISLKVKSRR